MKYIMLELSLGDLRYNVPVIFPDTLVHEDMGKAVVHAANRSVPKADVKMVSAGFVSNCSGVTCYGRSESLDLDSRPEDGKIISTYDYTHGVFA